jgi:hypothetical protein
LSSTEQREHLRPSGTCTMPPRTIASGAPPWISAPRNFTWPLRGAMMPEIVFSVVVLPAPLAPSTVTIFPSVTERLTPRSACTGP